MNLALTLVDVINTVAWVLYVLIIARIAVSWLGLHPWHPVVRFLRAIVDPILRPFRRILPTFGGIDFSPLLAILVIFFVARLATGALDAVALGGSVSVALNVVLLIRDVLLNIIIVLGVLVLIRILLSLFNADPWHPLVSGVHHMTNTLVRPFAFLSRRTMYGHRSGVDLPAIATLVLYVVLYVLVRLLFDNIIAPAVVR